MQKSIKIAYTFFRFQYLPHFLITIAFCFLSGYFVSFKNLNTIQCAKILERYVLFVGILQLTPLFMPEQYKEIWRLEQTKKTSMFHIYIERFIIAFTVICVTAFGFLMILKNSGSTVNFVEMFAGIVSEMTFLGSIGFFFSAVTNQVVLGYMVAIIYYAINIGKSDIFGKFALFQMMKGAYDFYLYMVIGACILIVSGIILREEISKR